MISFNCPFCKQYLEAPEGSLGCRIQCMSCENKFELLSEHVLKEEKAKNEVDLALIADEPKTLDKASTSEKKPKLKTKRKRLAKKRATKRSLALPFIVFLLTGVMGGTVWVVLNHEKPEGQVAQGRLSETSDADPLSPAKPIESELTAEEDELIDKSDHSKAAQASEPLLVDLKEQKKLSSQEADAHAQEIDELIENNLSGKKGLDQVDDLTFLRRAYLDISGRIPTLKELYDFKDDTSIDKRKELIDHLLYSEGFVSHYYNYWANVLRAKDNTGQHTHGHHFIDYIKESLRENKPYDQFVREMLAAEGGAYGGAGATGYMQRDVANPLANVANTMKVFLGVDMTCAQCHDDPFEDWTQVDFYKIAAFNSGTLINSDKSFEAQPKIKALKRYEFMLRDRKKDKLRFIVRDALFGYRTGLYRTGSGVIKLPHDFKSEIEDEYKPFDKVYAAVPFADEIMDPKDLKIPLNTQEDDDAGKRQVFAQWATSKHNPMFTKSIVNRLWLKVMGAPLVGPRMNLKLEDEGNFPQLTKKLENLMQELDFDLKAFLSVLYRTKTYQSVIRLRDLEKGENLSFDQTLSRRLSAEQLWDSLGSLKDTKPDLLLKTKRYHAHHLWYELLRDKSYDELVVSFNDILSSNTKPLRYVRDQHLKKLGLSYENNRRTLVEARVRASEQPQPVGGGHFLRQFGLSEREQVDASFTEAAIPQVLAFMNGDFIERSIIDSRDNYLAYKLQEVKSHSEKVDNIFLAVLARYPNSEEKQIFSEGISVKNILWTLLNSNDFKFYR